MANDLIPSRLAEACESAAKEAANGAIRGYPWSGREALIYLSGFLFKDDPEGSKALEALSKAVS